MTAIRKRTWKGKDGEGKTAWQVDYRDAAGKRRSKQFSKKKEAEAWITQASWEISKGIHTPDSQSVTIARAADMWLESVRANGREPTTVAAYDQHIRLHIVPRCGAMKVSTLTTPKVRAILDDLLANLSRPMALRVLRTLKAIITDAQERGLVAQNVALPVRAKNIARPKGKVTPPTKEDLRALLEATQTSGAKNRCIVQLAIFTGLRASEIRGLAWSNVNLRGGFLTVTQRADAAGVIGPPKSKAGHRKIPIPPRLIAALKEWSLACPKHDLNLVFPSAKGRPLSHRVLTTDIIDPVQIAARLTSPRAAGGSARPRYTLHAFRHAAASLWIEQGLNPKRIQMLMGHSSIQVTFDTYGHLFEQVEKDRQDASAIERALFPDATKMQHRP